MSKKLDAAIAEALGWKNIRIKKRYADVRAWGEPPKPKEERFGDIRDIDDIPLYSTDGNAMLELDREMRERGWRLFDLNYDIKTNLWYCEYEGRYQVAGRFTGVNADTMPEAVALASYKALTGKEWNEG